MSFIITEFYYRVKKPRDCIQGTLSIIFVTKSSNKPFTPVSSSLHWVQITQPDLIASSWSKYNPKNQVKYNALIINSVLMNSLETLNKIIAGHSLVSSGARIAITIQSIRDRYPTGIYDIKEIKHELENEYKMDEWETESFNRIITHTLLVYYTNKDGFVYDEYLSTLAIPSYTYVQTLKTQRPPDP